MKKEKLVNSESFAMDFDFLFCNDAKVQKTKEKLVNKKEKELMKTVDDSKMSQEEKEKLKNLILKLKNDKVKAKNFTTGKKELIKSTNFTKEDAIELNFLVKKYNETRKKKKEKKVNKIQNVLYFENGKMNKKYLDSIQDVKEKELILEYLKIESIGKNESDIIKDIEYENMKMQKILQLAKDFEENLKSKNKKDVKKYNVFYLKSNVAKNIKNSKLVKIEKEKQENIFGSKGGSFENEFLNKINNKFIIDYIEKEEPGKIEKIKSFLNNLENIKNEYNLKSQCKKDYLKNVKNNINKKATRITRKYIEKNGSIDESSQENLKNILKKVFEKELRIYQKIDSTIQKDYTIYNKQYKNFQNKIQYNSKEIKSNYGFLLSE